MIMAVIGTKKLLLALKAAIEAIPLAGIPTFGLVFVQLNVVPLTITLPPAVVPVKLIGRMV